jgi:uncharacterized protein YqeY
MSLKGRLEDDVKAALRAGQKERLSILRLALASIKQREVDTRQPLDDAGVEAVLERLVKQGRESLNQYLAGGRADLAAKEEGEIATLQAYLPEPLSEQELDDLIAEAIDSTGATGMQDIGKIMGVLKARASGRVDMREANARVRAALSTD